MGMAAVQFSVSELIEELQHFRGLYGNVPVEVYDATNWETLPFLAVEYSEAPGSVLLIATDTGGEGR